MTPIENGTGHQRLAGRGIVVTGGGHGIGRAYCRRLAEEGANVAIADLDGDAAMRRGRVARGRGRFGSWCRLRRT